MDLRKICCFIELEGFYIPIKSVRIPINYDKQIFVVREVAYVRMDPQCWYLPSSRFFDLRKFDWAMVDPESARAIRFQIREFHGLSFLPTPEEVETQRLILHDNRVQYMEALQERCSRGPNAETIAYYSGQHERELICMARIPPLALNSYDCPTYESLLEENPSYADITCGFHNPLKADTCPRARVTAYRDWWMKRYSRC